MLAFSRLVFAAATDDAQRFKQNLKLPTLAAIIIDATVAIVNIFVYGFSETIYGRL
jgi:hypothetical protein